MCFPFYLHKARALVIQHVGNEIGESLLFWSTLTQRARSCRIDLHNHHRQGSQTKLNSSPVTHVNGETNQLIRPSVRKPYADWTCQNNTRERWKQHAASLLPAWLVDRCVKILESLQASSAVADQSRVCPGWKRNADKVRSSYASIETHRSVTGRATRYQHHAAIEVGRIISVLQHRSWAVSALLTRQIRAYDARASGTTSPERISTRVSCPKSGISCPSLPGFLLSTEFNPCWGKEFTVV